MDDCLGLEAVGAAEGVEEACEYVQCSNIYV